MKYYFSRLIYLIEIIGGISSDPPQNTLSIPLLYLFTIPQLLVCGFYAANFVLNCFAHMLTNLPENAQSILIKYDSRVPPKFQVSGGIACTMLGFYDLS